MSNWFFDWENWLLKTLALTTCLPSSLTNLSRHNNNEIANSASFGVKMIFNWANNWPAPLTISLVKMFYRVISSKTCTNWNKLNRWSNWFFDTICLSYCLFCHELFSINNMEIQITIGFYRIGHINKKWFQVISIEKSKFSDNFLLVWFQ